jgi:hypothetical protein
VVRVTITGPVGCGVGGLAGGLEITVVWMKVDVGVMLSVVVAVVVGSGIVAGADGGLWMSVVVVPVLAESELYDVLSDVEVAERVIADATEDDGDGDEVSVADVNAVSDEVDEIPAPAGTVVTGPVAIGVATPSVIVYVLPSKVSNSVHANVKQQTASLWYVAQTRPGLQ